MVSEAHLGDLALVSSHLVQFLARLHVPEMNQPVETARDDPCAIGRVGHGAGTVLTKLLDRFAGVEVPDLDAVVAAARPNALPVGRDAERTGAGAVGGNAPHLLPRR